MPPTTATQASAAPKTSPDVEVLAGIKSGRIKKPSLFLIYGPEGEGKTKLASEAPDVLFQDHEGSSDHLNVARLPRPKIEELKEMTAWEFAMRQLAALRTAKHGYKTLTIDTIDWLEPQLWAHICQKEKVKSIELAAGGYGKGFLAAIEEGWRPMLTALNALRDEKGMTIILLAHSKAQEFNDPAATAAYMRYQPSLQDGKAYSATRFWSEAVDALLFLGRDTTVTGKDGGARGFDDGTRYLYTERRPGWSAKNRLGLVDRIALPLGGSWEALQNAVEWAKEDDPKTLIRQIKSLQVQLADPEKKELVDKRLEEYGEDVEKLITLKGKVDAILGQQA